MLGGIGVSVGWTTYVSIIRCLYPMGFWVAEVDGNFVDVVLCVYGYVSMRWYVNNRWKLFRGI